MLHELVSFRSDSAQGSGFGFGSGFWLRIRLRDLASDPVQGSGYGTGSGISNLFKTFIVRLNTISKYF